MNLSRLWVLLCLGAVALAQAPFRVDVQLINVGFSVRDTSGRLITNLTENDIEVLEDGVPQKVAFFARSVDVPLNLGLIVDLSGSQGPFIKQHHKDLKVFLGEVLTQRDRAFLACFTAQPRLVSDYSASAKFLADALEGYQGLRDRTPYPRLGPAESRSGGTSFYDAIYYATLQMMSNEQKGRKALVIFSDGEDNSSAHHMLDVIEAAQINSVMLFCIRYTEMQGGHLTARNKYGTSVMARIARETGGADYDAHEKGLAENFREIGEQLRSSYEMAYHSSNPLTDDSFHKVQIKVKQPGLTVRAKTGYYSHLTER